MIELENAFMIDIDTMATNHKGSKSSNSEKVTLDGLLDKLFEGRKYFNAILTTEGYEDTTIKVTRATAFKTIMDTYNAIDPSRIVDNYKLNAHVSHKGNRGQYVEGALLVYGINPRSKRYITLKIERNR